MGRMGLLSTQKPLIILRLDTRRNCTMNERIQELAYQAEEYADTMVDGGSEFHPVFVKKLAELIDRECVQTLIDNTSERYTNEVAEEDWDKGYDRVMKDWVHHIQEHFGIEE